MSPDNAAERAKQSKPSPFAALPFDPWPAALPRMDDDPALPLVIGAGDDLALRLPEEHWAALRKALSWYCSRRAYLLALACEDAMRFDIDGRAIEPVDEIARLVAAVRLLERALRNAAQKPKAQAAPLVERAKALTPRLPPRAAPPRGRRPIITLKRASP